MKPNFETIFDLGEYARYSNDKDSISYAFKLISYEFDLKFREHALDLQVKLSLLF